MHQDELRRIERVKVCCRVDVRDRFGIWTAVTDDVCARGCRLVTAKLPRVGSILELTLSSDLFPEVLEVTASVAWVSDNRVGINFASASRTGGVSPEEWFELLVHHAKVMGPELLGSAGPRLAPNVRRPPVASRPHRLPPKVAPPGDSGGDDAFVIPGRNR